MDLFGLRPLEITKIRKILQQHPEVKTAILYGSRAKDTFKPASDIDLTLTGSDLTLSTLLFIDSELDDLLMPYKIDLSIYHQISNPDLLAHINRVGKILYSKTAKTAA